MVWFHLCHDSLLILVRGFLNSVVSNHPGRSSNSFAKYHFDIHRSHGRPVCLVHEPLGTSAGVLLKDVTQTRRGH